MSSSNVTLCACFLIKIKNNFQSNSFGEKKIENLKSKLLNYLQIIKCKKS